MTDKIPPRPEPYVRPSGAKRRTGYWQRIAHHEHAVANVAVEALREMPCHCGPLKISSSGISTPMFDEWVVCPRCESLRQIEESGWQE